MSWRNGAYGPAEDQPIAQGHPDAGEYSWGPGLTPTGLEDAAPADGGRYHGKTPKTAEPSGLRHLADRLTERG